MLRISYTNKAWKYYRNYGFSSVLHNIGGRVRGSYFPRRARCWRGLMGAVARSEGIEIGGLSQIFSGRGLLPIYRCAGRIDNCDFSDRTIWERSLPEQEVPGNGNGIIPGRRYIREAGDLHGIPSERYEFVCSSHMIEHTANPLKALFEWIRVLKRDGTMILVVPHKDGTFDHRRPVTTLEHMVDDFTHNVGEDDLTHLDEILELHDFERDAAAGNFDEFSRRARDNYTFRSLHHHVFDTGLVLRLVDYVGLEICSVEASLPFHIIVVGKKIPGGQRLDNSVFLRNRVSYSSQSPFESDRP